MHGEIMHFEILVEDQSGKIMLDILIPKIIGDEHTFNVKSYKGVGHISKNMKIAVDAKNKMLLNNLPKLLTGYGKTWNAQNYKEGIVIVVCDLDNKCLKEFRNELIRLLNNCNPTPETRFCVAIEEGEAWFLGDMNAIKRAYPNAKDVVLKTYENDSICGTWEKLADAIYKGGTEALKKQNTGTEKCNWAKEITPYLNLDDNKSPSFNYFLKKIRELI